MNIVRPSGESPISTAITAGINSRFLAAAAAAPAAPAVIDGSGSVTTYADLAGRARTVRTALAEAGVRRGDRVGICWEVDTSTVVAILGVLAAGAVYVPLDPRAPDERIRFLLRDAAPAVVLCADAEQAQRLSELTPGFAVRRPVAGLTLLAAGTAPRGAEERPDADDPGCYVIYTSGSTGLPKGVPISHRNLMATLDAAGAVIRATPADRWSVFHSFSFDFSVWELFGPLTTGGAAVLVPPPVRRDPALLKDLLDRRGVTVLSQTPSAFRGLIPQYERAGTAALRVVVFGGERLDPGMLSPWFERHGDEEPELINMYGITECTIHVTHRRIRADDAASSASPIGRPLGDLRVHLLDDAGREITTAGTTGEMYVAGDAVAAGYLNRAPETAAAFVADPRRGDGPLMYRTGDLACLDPRGELLYQGRRDRQIKIRGHRIEPGEVQAALAAAGYPGSLAVARPDRTGQVRLVAYVVSDEADPERRILGRLREMLPAYLVPSRIVAVPALPLTANGKVDEERLPEVFAPAPAAAPATSAGDRAAVLRGAWVDVLGLVDIDEADDFFDIGGDSLLAIRVASACSAAGYALTVEDLYRHRTLTAVAEVMVAAGPGSGGGDAGPAAGARMPATLVQQGILFEARVHRRRFLYHDFAFTLVSAPFDEARLRRALRLLALRQPALRTSFDAAPGGMEQVIAPEVEIECEVSDLRDADSREADFLRNLWLDTEQRRGFAFDIAPLFRAHAIVLNDTTFRLCFSFHHAVLDGWSVALLIRNVLEAYGSGGAAPEPPAVPATVMKEYVALEREAVASAETAAYWRDLLSRTAPADFARVRAGHGGHPSEVVVVPLGDLPVSAVRRAATAAGTSVKTVLLGAHLAALAALSSPSPAVSSTVVVGARPALAGSDTVAGRFRNTLPVTIPIASLTWRAALRALHELELEQLGHRRFPLAEMAKMAPGNIPNTLFNFTDFHVLAPRAGGRLPVLEWSEHDVNNFDLCADYSVVGERIQLLVRIDLSQVPPGAARAYAETARSALNALAGSPSRSLDTPIL